jgi:bacteriocin-like protein
MAKKTPNKKNDKEKAKKQPAKPAKDELTDEQLDQVTGGGASSGAGAGKIKFNEFTITKTTDSASPS